MMRLLSILGLIALVVTSPSVSANTCTYNGIEGDVWVSCKYEGPSIPLIVEDLSNVAGWWVMTTGEILADPFAEHLNRACQFDGGYCQPDDERWEPEGGSGCDVGPYGGCY